MKLIKQLRRKRVWYFSGLLILDALLFGATDAATVPAAVVVIGFILLLLTLYAIIGAILALLSLYGLRLSHRPQLAGYLSVMFGGLMALQSIGELDKRDVLVLLPLIIVGYLYSAYVKTAPI
jgi:hypothetical protein